jgi:HD superfamily phosphohydrolase
MTSRSAFYDPLYDYVTFEEAEAGEADALAVFRAGFGGNVIRSGKKSKQILPFLKSLELNRLNFLRQSGLAFLVYPSATHTRFAHSIGSCYLGFMACDRITVQIESDSGGSNGQTGTSIESMRLSKWLEERGWREEFLLALLLHDIGHFPFSHTLESNFDFWASFPVPVSHEEITCELITGDPKSDVFLQYKKHLQKRLKREGLDCPLVSELVAQRRRKGIDSNVLCFLISGQTKYLERIDEDCRFDVNLAHQLVSGLLDLDRIDHYRRDSYYTGLKFGSNLNFAGLLGGMTLHYYSDSENKEPQFELRLSSDAIGHALTLLHSKERLVHDCFDHPANIAYDAMLHLAINAYLGIREGHKLDEAQVEKAYDLFFLTDDELLTQLMEAGDETVRGTVLRIRNRMPAIFVGKCKVKATKNSLRKLRKIVVDEAKCSMGDLLLRPVKHYGSRSIPTIEWMHLHYLFDEHGNNLADDRDYEEQIKYFQRVQDQARDWVWFFTPDQSKAQKIREAIQSKVMNYGR